MYINRLVDHRLKGLYFLQIEKTFMKEKALDITAFYDEDELRENAIYEDYYILETVLTSPKPSIVGFHEDGTPCYVCETRTPQELRCVEKCRRESRIIFRYIVVCVRRAKQKQTRNWTRLF